MAAVRWRLSPRVFSFCLAADVHPEASFPAAVVDSFSGQALNLLFTECCHTILYTNKDIIVLRYSTLIIYRVKHNYKNLLDRRDINRTYIFQYFSG